MIKGLLFFLILNGLISKISFAQPADPLYNNGDTVINLSKKADLKDTAVSNYLFAYPPSARDFKKLAINTSIYFGTSLLVFGALNLCPESVSGYKKTEFKVNSMFSRWHEHVREGPMLDGDKVYVNYVFHPYCGAVYYMTARSCGFKSYECFLYSAVMSTFFWEYGVEAFAEVPSTQDLLVTPIVGSAIGEGFFYIKKQIVEHDRRVLGSKFLGAVSLFVMDPFNTILDGTGYKQKVKTQLNIAPAVPNNVTGKNYLQLNVAAFF
jgi:hypothetical protein